MLTKLLRRIYAIAIYWVHGGRSAEYQQINKAQEHTRWVTHVVRFINDINETTKLCWIKQGTVSDVCQTGYSGEDIYFTATVGSKWSIKTSPSSMEGTVEVVGGRHEYSLNFSLTNRFDDVQDSSIVHVRTPTQCEDFNGYPTLGISWRDGARVAAHRHSLSLCMCGEYNATSSFTVDVPNSELPTILLGDRCKCDDPEQGAFDLWIPCNFMGPEPRQLVEEVNCDVQSAPNKIEEETRVFLIHTTTEIDRLSLKNKMWESFRNVFGVERASLLMPRAYWLSSDSADLEAFRKLCQEIAAGGRARELVFIMKDVYQHRQHGIKLSSAQQLINKGLLHGNGVTDGFSMATEFLPRPFLVNGYKLNMRRYLVAVCTGGRLRGYVHDDGKNIYTKQPYREPWDGEDWESNLFFFDRRLDELITTGYVDESHYDDKPLSGLEFFEYVEKTLKLDASYLQASMWERLALALHMSISDGDFHLCDMDREQTHTASVPSCLQKAVRFQHFGCDFHVDASLTGHESRLFECNKGPDFSVHSYRDGKMKREVAADVLSFIGFKGPFDGSAEHARKFKMNLIYDSETYDPNKGFEFLESLEHVDPKILKGERDEL